MSTIRVNNMTNVGGDGPTYVKGSVIQVVHGSTTTPVNNSSTSFVSTGLTATITPKSVNSKILVVATNNGVFKSPYNADDGAIIELRRGSTVISTMVNTGYTGNGIWLLGLSQTHNVVDSPATTSPVTYTTYIKSLVSGSGAGAQRGNDNSQITLMEIAG